jgi:hypothetical protein
MNLFWKKKKLMDERIINTKNKIYKEAFIIVMAMCVISIAVKHYFYGYDFKQFATEVAIIAVSSLYFTIRSVLLGLYSDEVEMHDRNSKTPMSIKNIVIGVSSGVLLALFFGIRSSILYAQGILQRVVYFVIVFITCLMIYCPFFITIVIIPYLIGNKASKKRNSSNDDSIDNDSDNVD